MILFHTNNRFRVPLIPLVAVVAAGGVVWWRDWHRWVVAGIAAAIVFPPWANVAGADTTIQDYVLLADAAHQAGRDHEAKQWAQRALQAQPGHQGAQELVILADYNLLVTGQDTSLSRAAAEARLAQCQSLPAPSRQVRYIAGVYAWKLGRRADALATWSALLTPPPHQGALAALLLCDPGATERRTLAERLSAAEREAPLHIVLAELQDATSQRWLNQQFTPGEIAALRKSLTRLFAQFPAE